MFILKKGHQPGVYLPLRALFLVLLPRIMLFFKPEALKNGMKFELRNSIKGVSVI